MPLHPTVLWAQRADLIFLTVDLIDITDPKINLTSDRFQFKAKGGKEQNEYECEIEFLKSINVEKSTQHLTAHNLSMTIYKAEGAEGYWDKLQKGGKLNFLKTDFNKWRDEDDEDDEDPMAGMPGMPGMGGGMPDMANMMGGAGGMDFSQFLNNPELQNMVRLSSLS
ncbi:HSP20-like chaperone [Halteromyces radiatus]|uniref:HSP20-like chaperone n=1 Tax=Halteromyces radiatus TaxID=101107 RepID=UPI00221F57FB|nr:HSP20-like chaperone [Halteromyces radiatus]KAI8097760.1 HSP20-like chaperone [Halteromyces radiatus]